MPASNKPKVAIVYHFFPHYRSGIIDQLRRSERYEYLFVADDQLDEEGIPHCDNWRRGEHLIARCRKIGRFYWQPGVFRLLTEPRLKAVIFLGVVYFLHTWLVAILLRLQGRRVYFWTHGWTHDDSWLNGLIRLLFYRIPHGFMFYGSHALEKAKRVGLGGKQLAIIYNSLDYAKQCAIRESISSEECVRVRCELFGEGNDLPIICCTARLTDACRFDLLLQALHLLEREGARYNLLLVGDGPQRATLQTMANELGVRAVFVGAVYDEERVARLIVSSDLTVSPGKIGLAAIHSLGYGVPVITHGEWEQQMPEYEAIEPKVNGDLFLVGDVKDLARAIRHWFATGRSREDIRKACIASIEAAWTPAFQRARIEAVLAAGGIE
jgi:glycosyltransferase involved in cell wall biosynthesis